MEALEARLQTGTQHVVVVLAGRGVTGRCAARTPE